MKHKLQVIKEDAQQEIQEGCAEISSDLNTAQRHMNQIGNEYRRVTGYSRAPMQLLDDIDAKFEAATKLQASDVLFLFLATALQCGRIYLINNLTKIEKAGNKNQKEQSLHNLQEKLLGKLDTGENAEEWPYYASLNHIVRRKGVPYDATKGGRELELFSGANHRFSTLGHDPVLGLIFGTSNIMTNTITCVNQPFQSGKNIVPIITTNHVRYSSDYKDPWIVPGPCSTMIMLNNVVERTINEPVALISSLVKQIIHIGTDLYTPCGIQIPGANLVLSNSNTERLTKIISTGDIVKIGVSAGVAGFINTLITALHTLICDYDNAMSLKLHQVKTRKILMYSNLLAESSNVIITAITKDVKRLDIGGLIVTIQRLIQDTKFIHDVKKDFLKNELYDRIVGEEYDFMRGDS